jgi:hypothetical protein
MEQSLAEIKIKLQEKIFAHPSIQHFNSYSRSILDKLSKCHTSEIGVHQYRCNNTTCNHVHYQYHSCGNRHCPNCGGLKRDAWVEDRMSELLPIKYYHIVFTLPQELRSITMGNRKVMFDLLFESAHYTLLKLGHDPRWLGATLGTVSILHTHGQDLSFHPHIHCIVSGGGMDENNHWKKNVRSNDQFIFPRRVMEKIYKAYFLKRMYRLLGDGELMLEDVSTLISNIESVRWKKWNVYAKAPFGGPSQIIEYLGRYTHKVAITAHRIKHISDESIKFQYKDYADKNLVKEMTLSHEEFLRRFEQHILPKRFVKIRHGGYLAHRGKTKRLQLIYQDLKLPPPMSKVQIPIVLRLLLIAGIDISICPVCKTGIMILENTKIFYNGILIDINKVRNKGSPQKRQATL